MEKNDLIPVQVYKAFNELITSYGDRIKKIGERDGSCYYLYSFSEDWDTGFPQIVSFDGEKTQCITGMDAVRVLSAFNTED